MHKLSPAVTLGLALLLTSPRAHAQNGLSDERVSLPDGPGSIGGIGENVDVNANMGSATFEVPISIPLGENPAMTPRLALAYASGMGTGLAGIGWELGISSIERKVSKGLPTYTTEDLFAADGGEEMVYVGDLAGSRVYRMRFEGGFVRYRWFGSGASGYWTAEYPDGRTGWYGADATGTIVPNARVQNTDGKTFRYHLVEMRDTVGRRIVHTYTKQDGWPLPDEVQYAFGSLETPRFSVRMGYEARPDVRSDATPGFEIRLARRLSTIGVLSDATVIRRYELAYEAAGLSGGTTRLASITEKGRDGTLHPIAHRFTYTRTLAGTCQVGCETPFMVDMGTLPGGVDIQTGLASLIDINGDSLPDILESDVNGRHRFHISRLSTEGRPGFTGQVVTSAATTAGSSFILSNPGVQLLDVNGDGFTDIVDQVNGLALCNNGSGDWSGTSCLDNPGDLPTLSDDPGDPPSSADPLGMRFFDYDNDKRIDLLRTPDAATAIVSRNTGTGYQAITVEAIGAAFDAEELELTDINGDGLQDPVRLVADGASTNLQYKLNLGLGRWSAAWTTISIAGLASGDLDNAVLEDLDGDGLADIVLVAGTTVSYWRNENAGRFAAREDITSADVDGDIPERTTAETVLFADMNGNGTDDVTWVASNGRVRFLELFPVRPNLLARIENGIGWVRTITYGTSIAQRARDVGTANAWQYPLPQSMNVVVAVDSFVTLTGDDDGGGVHTREELSYRDGYYDGVEKDFRGFERVEKHLVTDADDGQDPALDVMLFDVGKDDVYHRGLKVLDATFAGPDLDVPMRERRFEYGDCPVVGVPATTPPVRHVCRLAEETTHQEGAASSQWKTTRTEYTYDGHGNVILERDHGVIGLGERDALSGCGACPELTNPDASLSSGPCGAQCLGDERIVETTFVVPGVDTSGAWLLNLSTVIKITADTQARSSERMTYYDGPEFEGLPLGKATRGLVTRVMQRTSPARTVALRRYKWDAAGNMVATLSPNGDPSNTNTHRRDFTFDERGLRVTRVTVRAGDYDLVQDVSYESSFLYMSERTDFRVKVGADELTPRNASSYAYDEHGRLAAIVRPGDSREAPTMTFTYELGDPVSRILARSRRAIGGPLDLESVACQDGRGRVVQTMNKVGDARWRVDGYRVFNSRGQAIRDYQPYQTSTGACATTPPADVPFRSTQRDALDRVVMEYAGDEGIYGTASVTRTEYAPLVVTKWDYRDSDTESPGFDTPTTHVFDGLDRVVRIERRPAIGQIEAYTFAWDELGNMAAVTDPMGHTREQEFDLASRVVRTLDPNAGETTYEYLASGLESRRTDGRGVTQVREYDALDRLVRRFDEDAREATLEETLYDRDADCTDCRNGAGRVVGRRYPLPDGSFGSDALGYDARGNNVLMRRNLEGHTFETTFTYDGDDKLVSTTWPDGRSLTITRDAGSRPTAIGGVIASVTYTPEGRRAGFTHTNGVTETFEYDDILRETKAMASGPGGTFIDNRLTYDRESNILTVADGVTRAGHPSHAGTFVYDAHSRLTGATLETGDIAETFAFSYDALHNLLTRTSSRGEASADHVGTYTYGEDAGPNAVTRAGSMTYAYDEAGQTTRRDTTELSWDHRGRFSEAAAADGELTEIAYGPDDERVMKNEAGGVTYYAGPDFVVRDGIASVYVVLEDRRVARLRSDALASELLPDANGDETIDIADAWLGRASEGATPSRLLRAAARRMLFEAQGDTLHLHEDIRGSIIAVTDEDGEVVAERSFNPYGTERASTGWLDEHAFTGKEMDLSGLLHFRLRMLDLASGRWLSPDPAFSVLETTSTERLNEAMATYGFVGGNPVASIDPEGDILFALLIKPLRQRALPNRRKDRGGGERQAQGGNASAQTTPTETAPKKPNWDSKHLVPRLERREAKLAALDARLSAFPAASPGESPQLSAERKALTDQRDKLAKQTQRLRSRVYPQQSNGLAYILPDVVLVTTVVGGILGGIAYGTGVFDEDGGGDETALEPASQSLIFGGN